MSTTTARDPELSPHEPNAGWAIMSTLKNYGVDSIFGIPGTHNLEFYRHLPRLGIRAVTARHEQGAGYAADAYAVVTGEPGVVVTTSGPGLLNALSAMGNAYCESRPMIVLSPGAPLGQEGSDSGLLHETKNPVGAVNQVALWSRRVTSAEEAIDAIHDAYEIFRTGRPRPVHIEVPLDVLEAEVTLSPEDMATKPNPAPRVAPAEDLERAIAALNSSTKPAIVAGGGARWAGESLLALAEALQAPVVTTINGKGAIPENHPLALGADIRTEAAVDVINSADVLLMVGTKVGEAELWGQTFSPTGLVIRVDRVDERLTVNWTPDIALHGDTSTVIPSLLAGVSGSPRPPRELSEVKVAIDREVTEVSPEMVAISAAIASHLPEDVIVAGDSSQVTYFGMASMFRAKKAGHFLYTPTFATLGYGLPAAVGAQVAAPHTPVVAVVGDGALMFSIQELATALEQKMSMVVVCVDNGGYGEIKANEAAVGISPIGVDLHQPDWAALAEAFGATGHRVTTGDALADAMAAALTTGGVHLIHLPTDQFLAHL